MSEKFTSETPAVDRLKQEINQNWKEIVRGGLKSDHTATVLYRQMVQENKRLEEYNDLLIKKVNILEQRVFELLGKVDRVEAAKFPEHIKSPNDRRIHLSHFKAKEIRRLHTEDGVSVKTLAKTYGVVYTTIKAVLDHRTWKDI